MTAGTAALRGCDGLWALRGLSFGAAVIAISVRPIGAFPGLGTIAAQRGRELLAHRGAIMAAVARPDDRRADPPRGQAFLFVDDLHWAYEASLDLLTYLVRRPRSSWSSPGAAEHVPVGHGLRRLTADACRAGLGSA